MLSYKLKDNAVNKYSLHPMEDYLRSLGIMQVESFIDKPSKKDELSPWLLDHMEDAIQLLHEGFTSGKHFFLQVDSDVDGITSSTIFYRYFKSLYPEAHITWRLHDGKEHGVVLDTVPEDADIVVLPDSGSMQLEEQSILVNKGKKVLILDHHNVSNTFEHPNVILVNNQISSQFSNKSLSGAGVVFKTIQAYDTRFPDLFVKSSDYYDLAALGILSDMMDMRDLDNNYIVYHGLHNIRNEMFKALIEKQSYSIKNNPPTKIDVVFYISPLINGMIRAGSTEEKEVLFRAFLEEPTSNTVTTTWRGQERNETFYQYAARIAYNVKNRQNSDKEKCFEFLKNKILDQGLDKNQIIVVVASKDDAVVVPQNITGLIAMELLKYFGKPTLVLRPKMENGELVYAGSGRAKAADGFTSFLQFVRDSKYSEYGEGHALAFGASIAAKNLDAFIQESNARLANVNFTSEFIEVDAAFKPNDINYNMIMEFAKYSYVYGNSIPEPKIAIEGIIHNDSIMLQGAEQTTVRITFDRLSCIKFKDKSLAEELSHFRSGKIKLIGRPQLNVYAGRESAQLSIEAIELEPIAVKSLF